MCATNEENVSEDNNQFSGPIIMLFSGYIVLIYAMAFLMSIILKDGAPSCFSCGHHDDFMLNQLLVSFLAHLIVLIVALASGPGDGSGDKKLIGIAFAINLFGLLAFMKGSVETTL